MGIIQIKHRWTGLVLYECEAESVRACLESAVRAGANLACADLAGADLAGANLTDAYLRGAYLGGANLTDAYLAGAKINWQSHALISEILWREADTPEREMIAAWIGRKTEWCWDKWVGFEHPEREWALKELAKWISDGDCAPAPLRQYAAQRAETKMVTQNKTFEQWLDELHRMAKEKYPEIGPYTEQSDREAWRGYYDDGYAPLDALNEELSYSD